MCVRHGATGNDSAILHYSVVTSLLSHTSTATHTHVETHACITHTHTHTTGLFRGCDFVTFTPLSHKCVI